MINYVTEVSYEMRKVYFIRQGMYGMLGMRSLRPRSEKTLQQLRKVSGRGKKL